MRIIRAVAVLAVASGIVLVAPTAAHADDIRARQWYLSAIGVTDAHETATGEGVTIGLVDSGIDREHQDLQGAVGEGATFGNTGNVDADQSGNGTADAAILAGRGHGKNAGVLGIAPGAEIVPAEIGTTGPDVQNQAALVAEAIGFLTEQKVDVIAVAIPAGDDEQLRVAVQQAVKSGISVVAANGDSEAGGATFPSVNGVVTAVGSDNDGKPLPNSAPAPPEDDGAVALAAPATDVPAAQPGNTYGFGTDPSFAAMIVAGTIALVKENQPDLDREALVAAVRDSASGEGEYDESLGYGVVDPAAALGAEASGRDDSVTGALTGNNTTMALIIAVVGVLGLAALVVIVRTRDRAHRLAVAGAASGRRAASGGMRPGTAPPVASGTAPPVASGDTGNLPRVSETGNLPRVSDTGTFPRVTDTPSGGMPTQQQPPPYGQQPPKR